MSSRPSPGDGGSFDVHLDHDGTAHFQLRVGGRAHLSFEITREQQLKIWARMRPAVPYLAASVMLVVGLAVVTPTGPSTTD